MGLNRVENTFHGKSRASERTSLSKKEREKLIKDASRYGKCYQNLQPGPLQTYVFFKSKNKKTKYFKNYIFVFQKTSTSLITMYPVPEKVLEDEKNFRKAKEDDSKRIEESIESEQNSGNC